MRIEWSAASLADLDRFREFLLEHHPELAAKVAGEIRDRIGLLTRHPLLGRPLRGRPEYREFVMRVLNADYIFQYRVDDVGVVILRVFHGRERREPGS